MITYIVVVFVLIAFKVSCGFPPNMEPNQKINFDELDDVNIFVGKSVFGNERKLEFQDMVYTYDHLVVGSVNGFFVVRPDAGVGGEITFDQEITWSFNAHNSCKDETAFCNNYIRVLSPIHEDELIACGTNGTNPECRLYTWNGVIYYEDFLFFEPSFMVEDNNRSFTYALYDDHLYVGYGNIVARGSTHNVSEFPVLSTKEVDYNMDKPYFIGSLTQENRTFFFFNEEAIESISIFDFNFSHLSQPNKTRHRVYPRIASVCHNDIGNNENYNFASWWKARINCSIPGPRPFHFDYLRGVSPVVEYNGKDVVFATFTTAEYGPTASAICGYSLEEMYDTFKRDFLGFRSVCGHNCGVGPVFNGDEAPGLDVCDDAFYKDGQAFDDIRILGSAVRPIGGKPFYVSSNPKERLTAVVAKSYEMSADLIIYAGTQEGKILRLSIFNTDGDDFLTLSWNVSLNAVIDVFSPDKCLSSFENEQVKKEEMSVEKILIHNATMVVAFKHCVIALNSTHEFETNFES